MRYSRVPSLQLVGVLATAVPFAGGCELADVFGGGSGERTLVSVTTTHHATAVDGVVPDRGDDGQMRVFETDEGWTLTLVQAYVVTTGVVLHRCDDAVVPIEMYRGALAEDMKRRDLEDFTLGGTKVSASEFCGASVHYGPYEEDEPLARDVEQRVAGATFYIDGIAERSAERVPFSIRSSAEIDLELDLSTIANGGPLRVTGDEDFPVELRISKTYDRLFDAIDFASVSEAELQEQVGAVLALETRASVQG